MAGANRARQSEKFRPPFERVAGFLFMKDNVELVGVIVKINGKKKVIDIDDCNFHGWEINEEYYSDGGVDLFVNFNKKNYKISVS